MKVLWLTNVPLPEASLLMNEKITPFGGWLVTSSLDLSDKDCELHIAYPKNNIDEIKAYNGEKIQYYAIPWNNKKYSVSYDSEVILEKLLLNIKPEVVHIMGTEFSHSLAMVNVCNKLSIKSIISIQGLVSVYSTHYYANLPSKIRNRNTLRDLLKRDNIVSQQRKFEIRGKTEILAIKKCKHIIGRTTWDKACAKIINPSGEYHHCNETLRKEFYMHKWDINKCERNTIFISQASYPIKGLHYVLEAMKILLKTQPDLRLYVAGPDISKNNDFKERLKRTSYEKYISELMDKYNLRENVIFTGLLDEKEMVKRYQKSHIFVCPSSIENSPNSLGEAMLLGVPCVASYVGGIPDMLEHKYEGFLYQSDAPYMMAHYIREIINNDELAIKISINAREKALKTHNIDDNTNTLLNIYSNISS
ncbi:glycosyltransferase family 4 protein [Alloiococcus sp. CFN-8]|uniref:glycosyltransferase family 4 protein n=1 Tax=Alloiococcus sp. CFN-8 TaxID=3416081 RepID=UPI003CF18A2B